MKKTRRLLCMLLVVVMLLGAIPAHAATPMTAAASLIAVPLSGKLFAALPGSDSISKALSVESTYSTETKSAPTSAPVEQTTFAAAPVRLADGTTGATVNIVGTTKNPSPAMPDYPYDSHKVVRYKDKYLVNTMHRREKVAVEYNPAEMTLNDLAGKIIASGYLVDLYTWDGTFVCQYDTRDGQELVIPCAPGSNPAQSRAAKAPAKNRTSFNDVKSGDWYYEAVTALAEGNVIHAVFDADPNGNFNPDATVTNPEFLMILKRLAGQETEGLVIADGIVQSRAGVVKEALRFAVGTTRTGSVRLTEQEKQLALQTETGMMRPADMALLRDDGNIYTSAKTAYDYMPAAYYELWKAMMADSKHDIYTAQNQSADAKAIRQYCQFEEDRSPAANKAGRHYAMYEDMLRHAYNLNLIRTPGSPEVIDLNAGLSRAEFCVILYRAGMSSFGCNAPKK